jgi:EAL domain-containing protein (putative c-di-GMP-specific phosphodiesterase class I)
MGCPRGQGFLVARPMPAERIAALAPASVPVRGSAVSAG